MDRRSSSSCPSATRAGSCYRLCWGLYPSAGPAAAAAARAARYFREGGATQRHAAARPCCRERRVPRAGRGAGLRVACARPRGADVIVLTNGRVIEADRAWYEGTQLRYEKDGGVYGLPRAWCKPSSSSGPPRPPAIPTSRARGAAGRQRPRGGDAAAARGPRPRPALAAGAPGAGRGVPGLGDARAARRRRSARCGSTSATRARTRSWATRSRPWATAWAPSRSTGRASSCSRTAAVERKLAGGRADARGRGRTAGRAVPPALRRRRQRAAGRGGAGGADGAPTREYARRLGFRPDEPIAVVLADGGRLPGRAHAGLGGGRQRRHDPRPGARPRGAAARACSRCCATSWRTRSSPRARGGNCPTWLQEGISQWLEGGDPDARGRRRRRRAAEARLLPLLTLEAPFQTLPPDGRPVAYAESLSAVAHIIRKRGEAGLVRLLAALGDGLPSEEALPVALALSYPEFQKSWEARAARPAAARRALTALGRRRTRGTSRPCARRPSSKSDDRPVAEQLPGRAIAARLCRMSPARGRALLRREPACRAHGGSPRAARAG